MRIFITLLLILATAPINAQAAIDEDFSIAQLRMLDKTTARSVTFEAKVGSTLKFGSLYIRTQACRKSSPIEQPESAAFLQIWKVQAVTKTRWNPIGFLAAGCMHPPLLTRRWITQSTMSGLLIV